MHSSDGSDAKALRLPALGLGCMRFPRDAGETERLVLAAIERGVDYFDTAYIYPNSEEAIGRILAKHGKRGDVAIATKLPLMLCKGPADFDRFFGRQLERLQTDHVDCYMMHMLADMAQWERLRAWGIEGWLDGKRREGSIRHVGFSFHGSQAEFMRLIDAYPWESCQIQYNYLNERYQAGKAGLHAAAAKGIPVIAMEPLLGGRLADGLPKAAVDAFMQADPSLTPPEWALRWLFAQPEVACVLSGMGSVAQLEENARCAEGFSGLTEAQAAAYATATEIVNKAYKVGCTGCNYCMPCPRGIDIPGCFAAYNTSFAQGWRAGLRQYTTAASAASPLHHRPFACVRCGKCEAHCPQHLPIMGLLRQVGRRMEPLPVRAGLAAARAFMK